MVRFGKRVVLAACVAWACWGPAWASVRPVAVVADLEATGVTVDEAKAVSDLLRTELARMRRYIIVQRSQMEAIAKEMEFQMSGCTDQGCAVKLGQMLNAEKVIVGRVAKLLGKITLTAQVVDLGRNDIEAAEEVSSTPEFEAVRGAVKELAQRLAARVPVLAEVTALEGGEVVLDAGRLDGVEKGARYRVFRVEVLRNDRGEAVGEEKREVGEVEVTYADERVSKGAVVRGSAGVGDLVRVDEGTLEVLEKAQGELEAEIERMAKGGEGESAAARAERERRLAEARAKLERLKRKAAEKRAEQMARVKEMVARAEAEARQRASEKEARLAALREKAEAMRRRGGTGAMTLGDAVEEIERLEKAKEELAREYEAELEALVAPLEPVYRGRMEAARQVEPRDEMFETEEDYRARVAKAAEEARRIGAEWEAKKRELTAELAAARDRELAGFDERIAELRGTVYDVGPGVTWRFEGYDLATETFTVRIEEGRGRGTSLWKVGIPRQKARIYYHNPDLVFLRGRPGAEGVGYVLEDPEGARYDLSTMTCGEVWARTDKADEAAVGRFLEVCPEGPEAQAARRRLAWLGFARNPVDPVTGMEFVWVEGGCFQMGYLWGDGDGDENPVHEVCVDGFWMGKTEVTQAQWEAVMGSNPSHFKGRDRPVENV
ncbi:formylglycine-generating enzyme family protein, partial [Deferrisoma sp.]